MKNKPMIASLALVFATGCATISPQEVNSYEKVRTCGNQELEINFFVHDPSDKPDEDIFTKELLVKIEMLKSKYGAFTLWLYYKAVDPPTQRNLPEYMPDKIVVQTKSIVKKIPRKEFAAVWNDFMTPMNLTFIENCLFTKPMLNTYANDAKLQNQDAKRIFFLIFVQIFEFLNR